MRVLKREQYILYVLEFVIPIILGYIVWVLKEQKKERKSNNNGMMLLLRRELMNDHEKYTNLEHIPTYAYQNFIDMYNAYHDLGGNGMVTKMLEEIQELHFKEKR